MSTWLEHRPDPDEDYKTVWDEGGNEHYVRVQNVYLPGDHPRERHARKSDG